MTLKAKKSLKKRDPCILSIDVFVEVGCVRARIALRLIELAGKG